MSIIKLYKELPVHIVEFHNEVLPHIYRAIGGKYLPFQNIGLVHFDSHPDLGIPFDLKAPDAYNKDILFESIQIESWILPAVYAGHISTVIWCKPAWASQIPNGHHKFFVGKDKKSQNIRVSSTDPYFLSDCLYTDEDLLENKKTFSLHVVPIDVKSKTQSALTSLLEKEQCYILDIDLDFFSTRNPFREMFSTEDLATLTKLYWFEPPPKDSEPDVIMRSQEVREKQLDELRSWISGILNHKDFIQEDERFEQLKGVLSSYQASLGRKLDDEDVEIFHGAGCATDIPELPHHVSSQDTIDELVGYVEKVLKLNAQPPTLVTIARSSVDDYCPAHQVDAIQTSVQGMLQATYKPLKFHHHYQRN